MAAMAAILIRQRGPAKSASFPGVAPVDPRPPCFAIGHRIYEKEKQFGEGASPWTWIEVEWRAQDRYTHKALRDDRSANQLQATVMRAELGALIDRFTATDGAHATAIPRHTLTRISNTQHPVHTIYEPAFCVLAKAENGSCWVTCHVSDPRSAFCKAVVMPSSTARKSTSSDALPLPG